MNDQQPPITTAQRVEKLEGGTVALGEEIQKVLMGLDKVSSS